MRSLFFNVPIDIMSREEVLDSCLKIMQGEKCKLLYFINAHCLNVAQKSKNYLQSLFEADIVLNDGIGMKIASFLTKYRFKDNLNGTDLIPQLIQLSVLHGKKIYLIGGKPGVAILAKKRLEKQYPAIKICGVNHGYFSPRDPAIICDINRSKPDVLIVGMGVPLQELWIKDAKNELSSVKLCVAGGAILDFISGTIPRAPLWMRKLNLEWFYRLILEPDRMWRRYVLGNFKFFANILYLFFKQQQNQLSTNNQTVLKPVKEKKQPNFIKKKELV